MQLTLTEPQLHFDGHQTQAIMMAFVSRVNDKLWGLIYKMLRRNHPKFDLQKLYLILSRICIRLIHRMNVRTFDSYKKTYAQKTCVHVSFRYEIKDFYKYERWRGFKRSHTLRSNECLHAL